MERKKKIGDILQNYLDAQELNFIQHLQQQEQNIQDHLQRIHDIFSNNSENNSNKIEQQIKNQKIILEDNMKRENKNFKNKLELQKKKTNILLARTNVIIPNNNQRINHNNNNFHRNNNQEKINDKNLDFRLLKVISTLPTFQYRYIIQYEKRHEKTCSICLSDFKPDDILIRFSCKEHIFHKSCILTWLEKSDLCPLCKKSLLFK